MGPPRRCRRRRLAWRLAAAVILPAALAGAPDASATQPQPNVVVVMTDDQRVSDMEAMPLTKYLLGEAGTTFVNSFATYPLCCPSRSTFLSGQYAHNHGVLDNDVSKGGGYEKFDFSNALAVWLQRVGYRTAHIGKQLNGYGLDGRPWQRPVAAGYDDWFATRDPTTYSMYDYIVQDNTVQRRFGALPTDYQTDVLANRAVEDIRRWAPDDRPFFIHLAPSAVHSELYDTEAGPRPAPRHQGSLIGRSFTPRPNYDEADVSDKPSVVRHYSRIGLEMARKIAESNRQRLEALLSVDEAVARIVEALAAAGELDQTLIVFTSDNGYLRGEHRFPSEKIVHYEESSRVPLLVRGPGFPAGVTRDQLVGNVDLAPTIVALTGAIPGRVMDGESLLAFAGSADHRRDRSLLLEAEYEAIGALPYHDGVHVYYDAIRTRRFKYVHWFRDVAGNPADEEELYDLEADPFELQSLHASRRHTTIKEALKGEVSTLKDCAGDACRRGFEPEIGCLQAPLRARARALGPLRLGGPGTALLRSAGSPGRIRPRAWRYCVEPGGSASVAFSPSGRARLALTTASTRGTRGVRRGVGLIRLRRAYPGTRSAARGLVVADGGKLVFVLRRRRVRFVAVADRGLRRQPRRLARYLGHALSARR